jgi:hypothetical protein
MSGEERTAGGNRVDGVADIVLRGDVLLRKPPIHERREADHALLLFRA